MLFQTDETDNRPRNGTKPDKREEAPPPIALFAEGNQRQRRIRTRNMPIDGCMVPLTQALFPFGAMASQTFIAIVCRQGMIERRGDIRAQHAEEIENHPYPRPVVVALEAPHEEDDAKDDPQQDASAMRRSIPYLLFFRVTNRHLAAKIGRISILRNSFYRHKG